MQRGPEFPSVPIGSIIAITCIDVKPNQVIPFARDAAEIFRASKIAHGMVYGALDNKGTKFYTITVWQDRKTMEAFRDSEPHKTAMGKIDRYARTSKFVELQTMPRSWDEVKELTSQD